jgi:pimeloyl-ACP methyl ester carboxylesterase
MWPIPERGLHKRLHRITASTLVVWGENDNLIPARYAQEFGERIRNSRVEVLAECGHIPQMERMPETLALVRDFLAEA